MQKLQPLRPKFHVQDAHACNVAARLLEIRDKPEFDWVEACREDDRNSGRRRFDVERPRIVGEDHRRLQPGQFGRQSTDAEGRFRFKTIKPGAYPTGVEGWTRPPHIHFDVTGRTDRLVTQVYFPGEPLNDMDQLLQRIRRREAVIAKMLPPTQDLEPGSVIAAWDAVLARG